MAFAVLTPAKPLTVQVEVVLDDAKTGLTHADHADNVTTTIFCDMKRIAFPELEYRPKVRFPTSNPC